MDPTPATFRSHHGPYLNAAYGGGAEGATENGIPLGLLTARAEAAGADEQFMVEPLHGDEFAGAIAIRAAHGQYVCAEGGGHGLVIANRAYEAPGPWETFAYEVVDDLIGLVALRAHDGAYLTAEADGSIAATRTYDTPGPWELWLVAPGPPFWWTPPEPEVIEPPVGEITPPPGGIVLNNRECAGPVRLTSGRVCTDDRGSWLARGHSFFYVSRAWKDDRADRYERNMQWLARHGYTFYRGFASVGGWPDPDAWERGRTYPEWALEALGEWLPDAFDRYRLRCSLTLFDGEQQYRDDHAQDAFVQGVCDRIRPIIHTVQDVQVANEYAPCGWDYPLGIERLRRHARHLRAELGPAIVISISSRTSAMMDIGPPEVYEECHRLFDGLLPGIVTATCNHDSRETGMIDENWRHVRQGWERVVSDPTGAQLEPDASIDDEPMGPRSSVAEEDRPSLIVGKGLVDFVSGRHQRCDHSDAGIWSDWLHPAYANSYQGAHKLLEDHATNTAAAAAFLKLDPLLPPHLSIWPRTRHGFTDHPFAASFVHGYAAGGGEGYSQIWPDGITAHGCVRFYCGLNGLEFIGPITGVRDRLDLRWAYPMNFTVYTCKDGDPWQTVNAAGAGGLTLPQSVDTDFLVIGRFV